MLFRKASSNDVPALNQIANNVICHNYTPFLGKDATTNFIESGLSAKEIDDGLEHCTLLEKDGKIIAFAIVNEDLLHLIMVDVPFQNIGYGEALLSHLEFEMFRKYARIRLQTFRNNHAATQFYLKHGWRTDSQATWPDMDDDMIQFEKFR